MTLPNPAADASSPLGRRERMLLAAIAAVLALLLFGLRGGLQPQAPLEQLARRSPELPLALASGKPTVVEFYADWCEACRSMAPAMAALEGQHRGELNVVLLNVDNPRWSPEIDRYAVNGIPQLELFDRSGKAIGRSLGARSRPELASIMAALIEATPLPLLAGVGNLSPLSGGEAQGNTQGTDLVPPAQAGPRSHG
ncbi:thioredoxin domain-containing protein [Synechococcus sp. RedBA-s]|uniref:thioredoxin domain-containing protein n=1 Tax=Synechococcus sp. RedBA-s TaxID=2823741 RepID=UPI0020CC616D|nr:thioredoxin domain-containing protein [Synechococcus sp. RedBA-s]MCP9800444.1 redoxin domain-containing protein [Synechococcus sp. RedBA-s]